MAELLISFEGVSKTFSFVGAFHHVVTLFFCMYGRFMLSLRLRHLFGNCIAGVLVVDSKFDGVNMHWHEFN